MKCKNCGKTIKKNDWYFSVREFKHKIIIRNDFVHKNCQDEYDKQIKENTITPEQKKKMAEMLVKSFSMVKKLKENIGMEE